eukprot:gnl/MRDRNA2_/MRDRNA2_110474_c0_seq1.p1 gnl/MRDRNA2_/MRDRNA2_110474_c0~~gnl/MRDRNA2_/MRDRNA2_110474_c0_seq1.p1  ORF type:complete len:214 (+),score=56.82 gnl/MRDRNA2_/MRDRNA2_110474_c0_seq1:94-735(+)
MAKKGSATHKSKVRSDVESKGFRAQETRAKSKLPLAAMASSKAKEKATVKRGAKAKSQAKVKVAAPKAVKLGSVRFDFFQTHRYQCDYESRKFCYGKCDALKALLAGGAKVTADRDFSNRYDSNAISLSVDGQQIGFVSREQAADLAPALDAGLIIFSGGEGAGWAAVDFDVFNGPKNPGGTLPAAVGRCHSFREPGRTRGCHFYGQDSDEEI